MLLLLLCRIVSFVRLMYETLVSRALCVQTRVTWRRAVRPCTPTLSSSTTPTCCVTKSPATSLPPLADLPVSTLRKDLQARGAVHYQHQNPLDNQKRKSTIKAYVNIKMTSPPSPLFRFLHTRVDLPVFWVLQNGLYRMSKGGKGMGAYINCIHPACFGVDGYYFV